MIVEQYHYYIINMVKKNIRPRDIMTKDSFFNAISVLAALGGSTNAIIHLTAIAGRCGIKLELRKFDEIFSITPLLANVKPSGTYLIEDFHNAGGIPNLLIQLKNMLFNNCINFTGRNIFNLLKFLSKFKFSFLNFLLSSKIEFTFLCSLSSGTFRS